MSWTLPGDAKKVIEIRVQSSVAFQTAKGHGGTKDVMIWSPPGYLVPQDGKNDIGERIGKDQMA